MYVLHIAPPYTVLTLQQFQILAFRSKHFRVVLRHKGILRHLGHSGRPPDVPRSTASGSGKACAPGAALADNFLCRLRNCRSLKHKILLNISRCNSDMRSSPLPRGSLQTWRLTPRPREEQFVESFDASSHNHPYGLFFTIKSRGSARMKKFNIIYKLVTYINPRALSNNLPHAVVIYLYFIMLCM